MGNMQAGRTDGRNGSDRGEKGIYGSKGGHRCKAGTEGGKEARKGEAGSWSLSLCLSPFLGRCFFSRVDARRYYFLDVSPQFMWPEKATGWFWSVLWKRSHVQDGTPKPTDYHSYFSSERGGGYIVRRTGHTRHETPTAPVRAIQPALLYPFPQLREKHSGEPPSSRLPSPLPP